MNPKHLGASKHFKNNSKIEIIFRTFIKSFRSSIINALSYWRNAEQTKEKSTKQKQSGVSALNDFYCFKKNISWQRLEYKNARRIFFWTIFKHDLLLVVKCFHCTLCSQNWHCADRRFFFFFFRSNVHFKFFFLGKVITVKPDQAQELWKMFKKQNPASTLNNGQVAQPGIYWGSFIVVIFFVWIFWFFFLCIKAMNCIWRPELILWQVYCKWRCLVNLASILSFGKLF